MLRQNFTDSGRTSQNVGQRARTRVTTPAETAPMLWANSPQYTPSASDPPLGGQMGKYSPNGSASVVPMKIMSP